MYEIQHGPMLELADPVFHVKIQGMDSTYKKSLLLHFTICVFGG